jgi:hypothetical protein
LKNTFQKVILIKNGKYLFASNFKISSLMKALLDAYIISGFVSAFFASLFLDGGHDVILNR